MNLFDLLRPGYLLITLTKLHRYQGPLNLERINIDGNQCLSQDLETGCLKLAVLTFLGVQIFKGITIYSYFNNKHV